MVYRIDDTSAVDELPALPTDSIGQPGFFVGGNPDPTAAQDPTRVRFWWLNMVQEELVAFAAKAGIALDKGNNGQALAACLAMFSTPWRYKFVGNGTLIAPAWALGLEYELCAGGGAGGAAGANANGGGGCAGERRLGTLAVTGGASIAYLVGIGGLGNSVAANQGGNGGDSTLTLAGSPSIVAKGGGGGYGGSAAGGLASAGGVPQGGGAGGDIAIPGDEGQDGGFSTQSAAGHGGASPWGSAGKGTTGNGFAPSAGGYVSGGGGSYKGVGPGGDGAAGLLRYRFRPI